jgi:CubicO group peptidase (beta-lactamase class C family)
MLICLASFSQPVRKNQPPPAAPETEALLKQNQKLLGNDLSAQVYQDGKVVYKIDLEKEVGDFNGRTPVSAGICSQWLTAAVVMAVVDEGKVSLDDKVSKYIPLFAKYMKTYITLRNCLTNTTGIQADPPGPLRLLTKSKYPSLEEEVNAFASKREIATNPGTETYFSQIGPDIAARVLEIITKKPFDRLAQEKIFHPLKMRGTSFTNDNGGAINPANGAVTTSNDFINFLAMILNKGSFEGKPVLTEKAIAEMETMQFPTLPVKYMPKAAEGLKTGLGCWVQPDGKFICTINFSGFWPYVDRCHNYAALLLVKNPVSEPKKEIYNQFKETLDRQFGAACH